MLHKHNILVKILYVAEWEKRLLMLKVDL